MKPLTTLTVAVLLLAGAAVHAQSLDELLRDPHPDKPNLMKEEILRRGTMTERLGDVSANDPVAYAAAALATPPDDSHKWYISVISTEGCAACERLKRDFEQADDLRGWVNVDQPAESWAHYNVYRYEDRTQQFRFKKMKLKGFPTLLIQPPRNKSFGDPATVVWQKTGYDGNASKLNREMGDAIKRYVAKLQERGAIRSVSPMEAGALDRVKAYGAQAGPGGQIGAQATPPRQQATGPRPGLLHVLQAAYGLGAGIPNGATQPPNLTPIEGPPPFLVDPKDPKRPDPSNPIPDIPPQIDPDATPDPTTPDADNGEPASFDQLLRMFPDASDSFLRKAVAAGKTAAQVRLEVEAQQLRNHWLMVAAGATLVVVFVLGGFGLFLLLGFWFVMWISTRRKTPPPTVTPTPQAVPSSPAPSPVYAQAGPTIGQPSPQMVVQTPPPVAMANPPAPRPAGGA